MSDEEDVEQIRKKKLEAKAAEEQLRTALRVALDDAAYKRLMNISTVNEERFLVAAKNVLMMFKRAGRQIKEAELLALLQAIAEKSETKTSITFHKK